MRSLDPPRSTAPDSKRTDQARRPAAGPLPVRSPRQVGGSPSPRGPRAAPAARNPDGLPEALQIAMEAMSGFSLADVVVHRNSAEPARLGAHAFTKGNRIHVAPGQERHIPHEAWHAVQQKQGRVRATAQMKGAVSINDDGDLEREADTMGANALAAAGVACDFAAPRSPPPGVAFAPAAGADVPVQRKIGFEFETGNKFYWKNQQDKWTIWGRTKDDPMYQGEGFSIEGDTQSTPEIILEPMDDWDEIETAINASIDVLEAINAVKAGDDGLRIMPEAGDWKHATAFKVDDEDWTADIQVTHGVAMHRISEFLHDHLDREERKKRAKRLGKLTGTDNETGNPVVDGFIDLVIQFVADMQAWDGSNNLEGPKNAQVFMARNPYSKMLGSMSAEDQAAFAGLFIAPNKAWRVGNPVTTATDVQANDPVIKNPYKGSDKKTVQDPTTLKQWITEMISNVVKADKLSPPAGWKGGGYGMGLLNVDKSAQDIPLMLLEYRQTGSRTDYGGQTGKAVPTSGWTSFAEEQFELGITYDMPMLVSAAEPEDDADDGDD